ncbi:unnamed protein product [Arabidopsis thaliana]|uniref:(thale cress) hypothetical protein n=1 Tax=Arabidopsis thaliana TaxID=3702 RepID=A0A7G2FH57_ARATH|nr:unnamed protein product [Arabidopsis thaliana]
MLVEKICKKIGIDETSRKVKLSYILCTSQRETSIVDDDDFLGYLTVVNAKGIRPALNVEIVNKESERVEEISRVERRSSVGVNYEELNAFDVENGGVVTIFRGEAAGGNCVNDEPIIEEANSVEEAIENADSRVFEEAMENVVIEDREHVDSRIDVAEDNGVDGRIEYYELPCLNSFERQYSVIGEGGISYYVDLLRKTCSCRRFDVDKYPCVHAIAAARNFVGTEWILDGLEMEDLTSHYYHMNTWILAYHRTIYPVPHSSVWIIPDEIRQLIVLPPDTTIKPGRNQETRFPSTGERRRKRTNNKFQPGININAWLQPEESDS